MRLFETHVFHYNHHHLDFPSICMSNLNCNSRVLIERSSSKWQRSLSSWFAFKLLYLYVICNYNAANIDVMARYLLERLNYNLYYTLGKLILQFAYIYFFATHKSNSSNAATRERRQIL